MKKLFYILPIAAMLFAACDKIEMNEDGIYGVAAGAAGEWTDGNGVTDKSQRALIEKYTGAKCVNCPDGDEVVKQTINSYPGKAIAVAIESHTNFGNNYNGSPNLRCDDGIAWSEYYGAEQLPAALVSRTDEAPFINMSDIPTKVGAITAQPTKVAIAISNNQNEEKASIKVDLEFVESVSEQLTLTLLIMEDSLLAKQSTNVAPGYINDYPHNHMLRDVITDIWGADIDKAQVSGNAGEKKTATFEYKVNNEWNKKNCHLVAFISDKATKKILNVAECELVNE